MAGPEQSSRPQADAVTGAEDCREIAKRKLVQVGEFSCAAIVTFVSVRLGIAILNGAGGQYWGFTDGLAFSRVLTCIVAARPPAVWETEARAAA